MSGLSGVESSLSSSFVSSLSQVTGAAAASQSDSVFASLLDREVSTVPAAKGIDKTSELYEQCQELETYLLKNLISSMRGTVQKSGLLDTGLAGDMYEDMLYDEYAKELTKNAGFGFADLAYLELTGQRGS